MHSEGDHAEAASNVERNRQLTAHRRLLFRLIAFGMGTVSAFVIAEVALRLFVDQEGKRMATYDETLGWRGRPNAGGTYIRKVDDIRVPFHYNNLGFRDDDVEPKQEGDRRLLMLGDSFIENLEVQYDRTFPVLLERHINEGHKGWDVVVIGSQGYSTAQELLAYRKYHETVSPDVVLLCFYTGNDFEDNLRRRFAYLNDDGELQIPTNSESTWKHRARWLQRWLYESSHVVFWTKNGVQSISNFSFAPAAKSVVEADLKYKHDITAKLLRQLQSDVQMSGATFGVVVIPFRDDLVEGRRDHEDFVVQTCKESQIPCLDLSASVAAEDFFATDIHFNERGHEIVAKAIYRFVTEALRL